MNIRHTAMRAAFYLLCFSAGLLAELPARAQPPNTDNGWKQRKLTVSFQNRSLADIAGELADKTGKSIVIEGEPLLPSFDLNKTDTAEALLNEVAKAFDYSWHVGKSGALLFNKRFRNRAEYPQIVPLEYNESITDMLAVIQSAPASASLTTHVPYQMVAIARALSPQQLETLKQGGKLRVGSLTDPQRIIVERAIYAEMYDSIWRDWGSLNDQLAGLQEAAVQNASFSDFSRYSQRQEVHLRLGLRYGDQAKHQQDFFNRDLTENDMNAEAARADNANAAQALAAASDAGKPQGVEGLRRGVTTLAQAVQALAQETGTPLRVSPALAPRRLIVQWRRAGTNEAMSALAELEDWTWVAAKDGTPTLSRPARPACHTAEEVRQAVPALLPADMRRFLTAAPAYGEKEAIFPRMPAPYVNHDIAVRIGLKVGEQLNREAFNFFLSLKPLLEKQDTVPYSRLTAAQRDRLVLLLTLKACSFSVMSFTSCFDRPKIYESNPSEAYLMLQRPSSSSTSGLLLIGGEMTATQRGGAFGSDIMLDTLSAPDYVGKKSPAAPGRNQ